MPTPQKVKIRRADKYGYNAEALKVYLTIAGYKGSSKGLIDVLEVSSGTAYFRFASGEFKRREIQEIIEKLHLTPQQTFDIFFTSKPGVYMHNNRWNEME